MNVDCFYCGKRFFRRNSEVNRSKKLGRRQFCSRGCCGKVVANNLKNQKWDHLAHIKRADSLSPFRHHLKCIKNKGGYGGKRRSCFITLQDLKDQWDQQQGICPYTGWELKTPRTTSSHHQLPKSTDRASVDRIDNSKPYTRSNIQFISLMAQYAKNIWPEDELLRFCEAIALHRDSCYVTLN